MSVDDAVLDLMSDDIYLLWEIKAEAEANGVEFLDQLINHALKMVRQGSAHCWAAPIDGKVNAEILSADGAVLALENKDNWSPPKLDSDVAIWLGAAVLTKE